MGFNSGFKGLKILLVTLYISHRTFLIISSLPVTDVVGAKFIGGFIIPIYIQQDATLHSLFYVEIALHVSVGTTTHQQ